MLNTSILPLAGCLLLLANLVLWTCTHLLETRLLRTVPLRTSAHRTMLALLVVIISGLPVFSFVSAMQLPVMQYVRVITGDMSIVTLVILGSLLVQQINHEKNDAINKEIFKISLVAVPVSLALYATSWGWTYFDPYSHGYYPTVLSGVVLLLFLTAFWRRHYFIALALGAAFLAYALQFMDSHNLWDYLTDPILVIYGTINLVKARRALKGMISGNY